MQVKPNTLDRTKGESLAEFEHPWDLAMSDLAPLLADPWAAPLGKISQRQEAATFFAMRVLSRAGALSLLFGAGLYNDAYSVVRASYEDWLTVAFVLQLEDDGRWLAFQSEVNRIDARVYEAFVALCGSEVAAARFKNIPASVEEHLGKSKRELRKEGWPSFASIADSLGLRAVHDFAYTRLSTYSHPTGRSFSSVFNMAPGRVTARIPERNAAGEAELALWAWWFSLRTITIAQREFGIDSEAHSDDLLDLRGERELITCVLVRECAESS